MSKHPLNLLLVFILELVALAAMAYWGWTMHEGLLQVVLAVGVPLVAAAIWGIFRVPNDPREALVEVPGWVRLLLEAAFFGTAVVLLTAAGQPDWATVFGLLVIGHYVLAYDRVSKMLRGIPL
jgi:hypothetical protein